MTAKPPCLDRPRLIWLFVMNPSPTYYSGAIYEDGPESGPESSRLLPSGFDPTGPASGLGGRGYGIGAGPRNGAESRPESRRSGAKPKGRYGPANAP